MRLRACRNCVVLLLGLLVGGACGVRFERRDGAATDARIDSGARRDFASTPDEDATPNPTGSPAVEPARDANDGESVNEDGASGAAVPASVDAPAVAPHSAMSMSMDAAGSSREAGHQHTGTEDVPPFSREDAFDAAPDARLLDLGEQCQRSSSCALGLCVDGVCCDDSCEGPCRSCTIQGRRGRCSMVAAGAADTRGVCTDEGATSCGRDGKCDGLGRCRFYATGTVCQPAGCTDLATESVTTAARTCSGVGTCVGGQMTSCGRFRCDGVVCRSGCTTTSQCAGGYFCSGGTCIPTLAVGSVCTEAAQCTSGICGKRCCTQSCDCSPPHPRNLLMNPDFDTSVQGWTFITPTKEDGSPWAVRVSRDAHACEVAGSGAARLTRPMTIQQCIPVKPDTYYNVGLSFSFNSTPSQLVIATCRVLDYYDDQCRDWIVTSGRTFAEFSSNMGSAGWIQTPAFSFTARSEMKSAVLECEVSTEGGLQSFELDFDKVFFSDSGARF